MNTADCLTTLVESAKMKKLKWILLNGVFMAAVYFGFYQDIEGAYNIAMGIAWLSIIVSFMLMGDEAQKRLKTHGRSMPKSINLSSDTIILFSFAWHGAVFTAIGYFIHMAITEHAWNEALKEDPTGGM
jgi:hypothetical protein